MSNLEPPHVSFDVRSVSQKSVSEPSRSACRIHSEIETPRGPRQRSSQQSLRDSLASLAGVEDPSTPADEPRWPRSWRAYACLFGGFLLMFNSCGIMNAYGTYASYYKETLLPDGDMLLFNLVGSTQSFVMLLLSAPVGRFLDADHSLVLVIVGGLCVTVSSFLLSVVNGGGGRNEGNFGLIWLTQGFLTGLGMACLFVTSSQVVATWFKKKRSFAIGIVASGASIAGLVYPMMDRVLLDKFGFNDAQRYVSTLTAATCILTAIIARPRKDHAWRKNVHWGELRTYWDTHAFNNHAFALLTAAMCWMWFGFYVIFFNLEEWAAQTGIGYRANQRGSGHDNAIQTYLLLSIMNACSTVGRLGSSYLSDKVGALRVHAATTFVASLLVLVLWVVADTVAPAIAFAVLFGVFSGAVIGLPPASVAYILGPDGQDKLGQWTGMMYSCAAVFSLAGPVIAGHLITEFHNNFLTVQLWSGICLLMSAGCMAGAIWCLQKQKSKIRAEREMSSESSSNIDNEKSETASMNEKV